MTGIRTAQLLIIFGLTWLGADLIVGASTIHHLGRYYAGIALITVGLVAATRFLDHLGDRP